MLGQTISHYRIVEKLGGGGMGVVYKAQDLKLDRVVALKFLPSELTLDSDAKERFVHEAKAASSLQHHNICTIHDLDQTADGQMFIVMDLYEGETLKSRIAKGRLRIEEATDIAIQIAQGLAEAHEHGIIHRDIKPANVLITKSGIAKILDFGLAKLSGATTVTRTGSTLGTVAYMAPEQLQGSHVDARADIFSVGVVLYEMLTGKTPFRGDHEAALMYSIMNELPEPLQTYIPDVTSELIHVVSRALEKDPASRYKTMDDLLIDMRRVRKETSRVSMPTMGNKKASVFGSPRFLMIASVMVLAGIAIAVFLFNQPRKLPKLNPDGKAKVVPLRMKIGRYLTLSHDGKWIAFAGIDSSGFDIYYMNPASSTVTRVTHEHSGELVAHGFSQDGAWILYTRYIGIRPEIVVVPSLGGPTRVVANGFLAQFAPAGDKIFYARGFTSTEPSESGRIEICSINFDGSDKHVVFVDPGYTYEGGDVPFSLSVSPDGKSIAWIKTFRDFSQDIVTYNLETTKEFQVTFTRTPKDEVSWTHGNFLIYSSYANDNFDLWMCPSNGGTPQQLTQSRLDELRGELCDDGSRMLYYEQDISGNIKSINLETGRMTSITDDDRNRASLCVSPDTRHVAYLATCSYPNWLTARGIQIVDIKGEEPVRTVSGDERIVGDKEWSPNGQWIAYTRAPDSVGGTTKVCIVQPFGGTRPRIVAETAGEPGQSLNIKWVHRDTLIWFAELKTWICPIETSKPLQFFEDSTNACLIQGGKFVLYRDYRVGRQGWWTASLSAEKGSMRTPRKILGPVTAIIAPNGEFLLTSSRAGEYHRVSLPDGKSRQLPFSFPYAILSVRITVDGKSAIFVQQKSNSKLMLWENPFVKE